MLSTRLAAVMFPLTAVERATVSAVLGPAWEVRDGRRAEQADLVLLRPCSHQTLAGVARRFGGARVVLVDPLLELGDQLRDRTGPSLGEGSGGPHAGGGSLAA
jgi:hypothetical protein